MMASIPNMRSGLLPIPTGKAGPAGEAAPGDFAAQMPVAPGQPASPLLVAVTVGGIAPTLPETGEDILAVEGEAAPEASADAPDTAKAEQPPSPQPLEQPAAVVIPFLPQQAAAPLPQVPAPGSADENPPLKPEEAQAPVPASIPNPMPALTRGPTGAPIPAPTGKPEQVPAEAGAGTDAKAGGEKPELPLPATEGAPKKQAETPGIEAAVKELLQGKEISAKQVAAAPRKAGAEKAGTDAAPAQVPAEAQPQSRTQAQTPAPAAPATSQAPAPLPIAELPQPALAPLAPQPPAPRAGKAGTVEATRTTDLAVERQLDLARDAEWLDRLARDIARAGANDTPLRFRLHPQTLGHLQVELQQGDRGTAVRLTVETEAARQILADAQPRLAAEARAQGVRIAETHVDLSGSGRHAPGDQRRQDEARQNPLIRTAPGAGNEAVASARSSGRGRPDRYA